MNERALVVLTTVGSDEEAGRLANALVAERLAACVSVIRGVQSIYRWKGEVTSDEERLLVIKTTAVLFEATRRRIKELHSYEVPEVIALPVDAGDAAYLDWLRASVSVPDTPDR